ncbi:hypothetical protein V490_04470 [Pseudogymnoascus sp. VKM F-3557]|nr:hypothetical protein V490_04470 [Pseudogymnoascus sp. VKM F-3557]
MDDAFRENSGAYAVLQGAMDGALESGTKPSELLVAAAASAMGATAMGGDASILSIVTISDFNLVETSDVMGILKVAMRLALDHGTKPNELINVAVEGGNQCPTRIALFNFIIEAFKNRNPSLKRAVSPEEQPKKRVKTTAAKDGQKHKPDVADSDSGSVSDIDGIGGLSSNVQTLPGIRIIKMGCKSLK